MWRELLCLFALLLGLLQSRSQSEAARTAAAAQAAASLASRITAARSLQVARERLANVTSALYAEEAALAKVALEHPHGAAYC